MALARDQRHVQWNRRRFLQWAGAGTLGAMVTRSHLAAQEPPKAVAVDTPAELWKPLVEGNNRFAMELYPHLVKNQPQQNHFLSPFSISTALAMTALGARGRTAEQMNQVLHLPQNAAAAFKALLRSFNEGDPAKRGFTLATANALWAQKGYPWRPEYKKLLSEEFGAGLFDVDFISQSEVARTTINAWVEHETRDKIKELLPPGSINAATRLVLTNAIYFKGTWLEQFDKQATQEQEFTKLNGDKVRTPLMHKSMTKDCLYAEISDFQALDIPYTGQRLSMLVLLPRKHDGLPALERRLTPAELASVIHSLKAISRVQVYLPRFRIATDTYPLNGPLQALGIRDAFSAAADFSGMHTGPEKLYIDKVLHKAFVEVNEEGTEAAAATAVIMAARSAGSYVIFRADRPFLFLIRDRATGSILFVGRVIDPTVKS